MKISVIIPVYNSDKYLNKCLDSIINQTYKDWEVIAINDGSIDNSYNILVNYSKIDKRIKIYTQDNKGPGITRNRAINYATGEYIVFIDSDDYIDDRYFEDLISLIDTNNSELVFIDVVQETEEGKVIKYELLSSYKNSTKDTIIRHQMTGKLPWGGVRKVVKTSLIKENNIEYSNDPVGEEALFSFRMLHEAKTISFLEKTYYHYVNHPNSQSKKLDDNPLGLVCYKIKDYLESNNLLNEYKNTINSFGFTALIVSIYRMSVNHGFIYTLKHSRLALKTFKKNYGFKLDTDSLELRVKLMVPFAKLSLVLPIVLIAKLKKLIG